MQGQRGGSAPPVTCGLVFSGLGGGGGVGSVSSWLRLAYIVYVLHWSTRFLVGSLGHDSFAGRPACLGLQDMTGSTLEVCLCLSLVLLLRLVGLRCPSPNEHLKVFFTADPFLLDAHIDVCTRASDPTISFVQEVALLNCRSPLRFDRDRLRARMKCCHS